MDPALQVDPALQENPPLVQAESNPEEDPAIESNLEEDPTSNDYATTKE